MKKDGQSEQMAFSFPREDKPAPSETCGRNVVNLQTARQANQTAQAKSRESEVVNKILRASKHLNW